MRSLVLILFIIFINSCSTDTKVFSVKEKNTWFMQYPGEDDISLPIYCMANEHEKGASPVCYQAKLEIGVAPLPASIKTIEPKADNITPLDETPNTAVELDNR